MGITVQEGQKEKTKKRAIDIGLAILLVIIVIVTVKIIKKDFNAIDHAAKSDDNISVSGADSGAAGNQDIFVSSTVYYDGVNQGPLILVNNDAEYKWNDNEFRLTENEKEKEKYELVSLLDVKSDDGTDCYSVLITEDKEIIEARKEAALAMNEMLKAFNKATGHTDIRIDNAYRSVAEQQELYDNDSTNASKPGTSDYHTGYSIDLNVVNEDDVGLDFDGKGDFEWLVKNCYKYGFVIRYPQGKDDLTGQPYSPWHFRYVGPAHAAYMFEKGLCLEEYIKKLESFPYDGEHLKVSDASGKNYEIYYYAADTSTTLTSVVVPSENKYEISGNNVNGFIVTVYLDGQAEPAGSTEESSSDTQAAESASSAEEETADGNDESEED